jgi:alpha-L-fucosidase
LYLHVFNYPSDGKLAVNGIFNEPIQSYLLSDPKHTRLGVTRSEDALIISLPLNIPDPINTVVVLDIKGKADVSEPPLFKADYQIFLDKISVNIISDRENVELHYTVDGSTPTVQSPVVKGPILLTETGTVTARCFRNGKPVSGPAQSLFSKVTPVPSAKLSNPNNGIKYAYYEGDWDSLPDFQLLKVVKEGTLPNISFSPRIENEHFGFWYSGFVKVPADAVYIFYTASDDGSRLYIGDQLVVDNDGLHGMAEKSGVIALAAGLHPIRITFFEKTGADDLSVSFEGGGMKKMIIPDEALFFDKR